MGLVWWCLFGGFNVMGLLFVVVGFASCVCSWVLLIGTMLGLMGLVAFWILMAIGF